MSKLELNFNHEFNGDYFVKRIDFKETRLERKENEKIFNESDLELMGVELNVFADTNFNSGMSILIEQKHKKKGANMTFTYDGESGRVLAKVSGKFQVALRKGAEKNITTDAIIVISQITYNGGTYGKGGYIISIKDQSYPLDNTEPDYSQWIRVKDFALK